MGFLGGGNHIFIVNKDFLHIAPGLEEWTEVHAGSIYTRSQQIWEIAVSTASDLYIYNKGESCALVAHMHIMEFEYCRAILYV